MNPVNSLGDKIMSAQRNNSMMVQRREANNSNVVTTAQMFVPNQPDYLTNSYEPPARQKK